MRGRLDTAFRDTFFVLMCLAEGYRDPGTFFGREGAFSLPPQVPFSHALVSFFPPQVFCFFLLFLSFAGLRMGCTSILYSTNGMTHSERCSEKTPEHSATPPPPHLSLDFYMV